MAIREDKLIEVLQHWNVHGQIEVNEHKSGKWRLINYHETPEPIWDFESHEYRIPAEYTGPYCYVIWDSHTKLYKNSFDPSGTHVPREVYEKLLLQYEKLKPK